VQTHSRMRCDLPVFLRAHLANVGRRPGAVVRTRSRWNRFHTQERAEKRRSQAERPNRVSRAP
jgi:hypothetical protein